MIQTANQTGLLAKIAERLGQAGINIVYTYMTATVDSDKGLMILRPNDVDKALRWRICSQERFFFLCGIGLNDPAKATPTRITLKKV